MPNFFSGAREPMSSWTHFLGALLFLIMGIGLIIKSALNFQSLAILISVIVFVLSLVALYNTSWIYHYLNARPSVVKLWRKLDHSMIFVLIAGTYTPLCLAFFPGRSGLIFTLVIWLVALAGIIIKIFWLEAPRWLSTGMYLAMGWMLIFNCRPIIQHSFGALLLLLLGGIFYSLGAVIYGLKKPDISSIIGFHEFFHLFVILGSLCHIILVWVYIA